MEMAFPLVHSHLALGFGQSPKWHLPKWAVKLLQVVEIVLQLVESGCQLVLHLIVVEGSADQPLLVQ